MMIKIAGGLGLALILGLAGFKLYYDKAEAQKAVLEQQIVQYKSNEKALKNSIEGLNAELLASEARQQQAFADIQMLELRATAIEQESKKIRASFARHDLDTLTLRKPKLIEKIINKGTAEVLSDLETLTDPTS